MQLVEQYTAMHCLRTRVIGEIRMSNQPRLLHCWRKQPKTSLYICYLFRNHRK